MSRCWSPAQPAIDLLIPSDWNLKGTVTFGGGRGGCFGDLFAASWEATNPDGSISFMGAPNYSWQYTDDPTELRKLNDPLRRALGAGGKPCPIEKPMTAENYFREHVLPNLPSGSTLVVYRRSEDSPSAAPTLAVTSALDRPSA